MPKDYYLRFILCFVSVFSVSLALLRLEIENITWKYISLPATPTIDVTTAKKIETLMPHLQESQSRYTRNKTQFDKRLLKTKSVFCRLRNQFTAFCLG